MNKKIVISVGIIIILAVAYWLLSPLWRNVALNEELPSAADAAPIKDNMPLMDAETRANFEKQTMEMKDKIMKESDPMPASKLSVIGQAEMIARAHEVEGAALLVKSGNETFLRFENLKTINGPDLRIYLSSGLNADDIVDLGPIRATEGNVNYSIPAGTDLGRYKNAMIWCRAFGVLFSYAQF
ncbi:MAG: DM13 domain-containing protein [bacterium]|nr:DM13 domain-containing protein [bacterium]